VATIRFLKRVSNLQYVYHILRFIEGKASRSGYDIKHVEDEGSYGCIIADEFKNEFKIVFRKTEDGKYIAGGELRTTDLKLLKTAYVILRSIRANIEARFLREELAEVAFAEPEIESLDYGEAEDSKSKTESKTTYRRGQMTLDEVV
jgi:hypothetical protein